MTDGMPLPPPRLLTARQDPTPHTRGHIKTRKRKAGGGLHKGTYKNKKKNRRGDSHLRTYKNKKKKTWRGTHTGGPIKTRKKKLEEDSH